MPDQAPLTPWMRTTMLEPRLSIDAELELLRKVRAGDQKALDALMISQFKTVFHIARRYQNKGLDLDDLVQEAFLGLFKAIKKFNPDKGCCLSTYASYWISVTITRALTSKGHLIRLPVHAQALLYQISNTMKLLSEELERPPTDEELAERLGVDLMKMRTIKETWQPALSLDAPPSSDMSNRSFHSSLADPATTYDRGTEAKLHKMERLREVFTNDGMIKPIERAILRSRFGLDSEAPQTLRTIAERFGVTRERIRQIQYACLRRLRKYIEQSDNEFARELDKCSEKKPPSRRGKISEKRLAFRQPAGESLIYFST